MEKQRQRQRKQYLMVRLNTQEKDALRARADRAGVSVSGFVRLLISGEVGMRTPVGAAK